MNKPLFLAILEDESLFRGGLTYEKSLWLALPKDKKIKRLFYTMPDGNYLVFDMYDKYFLGFETTKDLNGQNAGKFNIENVIILAMKNDNVVCYKINLIYRGNKKIGDIERIDFKKTDPFIQGLSKEGWR